MLNNMTTLAYIIVFSLMGGLLSLSLAMLFLLGKRSTKMLSLLGMPFAAGALLAAVFLDLLVEGVAFGEPFVLFSSVLIGILLFFIAERFIRWFHHHHQHSHNDPAVPLLIVGDTIHNTLDGIAIAAAFLISVPAGIITTLAVAAHELPQEVGEFGLLLSKGLRRRFVITVNILSSLAATGAAVITYFVGQTGTMPLSIIFGISAGFLLYVALSDIIPSIHEQTTHTRIVDWQTISLLVGVGLVALVSTIVKSYI